MIIDHYKSAEVERQEANLRTLVKTLGQDKLYAKVEGGKIGCKK